MSHVILFYTEFHHHITFEEYNLLDLKFNS